MTDSGLNTAPKIKVACSECSLRSLCLPLGLDKDDLSQLDKIIQRPKPLQKNQQLYSPGNKFKSIYVVRAGSIKTFTTTQQGEQQIMGFHLPGEIIGLDGVSDDQYSCTAEALETTSVCELPFNKLEQLTSKIAGLQRQLHRLMSKELLADHQLLLQLGKLNAEERLAAFLLSVSQRSKLRGFSATEFNLPMTRSDIGNYLGLAVETVSRQFTKFAEHGVLNASRRHIELKDLNELQNLAGVAKCEPHPRSNN